MQEQEHIILMQDKVVKRFEGAFLEPSSGNEFVKNIVEVGRITAMSGSPTDMYPFDTIKDSPLQRELSEPVKDRVIDSYKITVELAENKEQNRISIEQIGATPSCYTFPECTHAKLSLFGNGIVSLEVNPYFIHEGLTFEEPDDKTDQTDSRYIYFAKNTDEDSIGVSGPQHSFGPNTVEFLEKFTAQVLKAFQKLESEKAAGVKNQSNATFTIYPN